MQKENYMKKLLALCLAGLLAVAGISVFAGCSDDDGTVKVGFIALHDKNSTYDKNFIEAIEQVCKEKNVTLDLRTGIPEDDTCYQTACELADDGCDVIFADSFSHEKFVVRAAKEYPKVQFCHATGVTGHTGEVKNFHNAFASIYEGRYLAGVAAGMKLAEMKDNNELTAANYDSGVLGQGNIKIGYVGAYPYAEVISGYTAFYLGAKSIVENLIMDVEFTGSWNDQTKEKETATTLITNGAALISQHADSLGAPSACEAKGVPNVAYNGNTSETCPKTYLVATRINWVPYFEYMIDCVLEGEEIDYDWCGTLATGSVVVEALGKNAAEGTQAKLDEVKAKLMSGELHVFDCSKFTVGGQTISSALADIDGDYTAETQVVEDGIYYESKLRSAPYFDLKIDGINAHTDN